ncbi:hypothetical protein [Bacillus sp. FJAT-29814]|uniref:hypothetical protein n=1 Tax=Bacillus sp. FJAT-29814 TaxID=1729688 RepID=UPI000ABF3787|nr:hypothetical protein [Bacillus sp. FJAT-29814]
MDIDLINNHEDVPKFQSHDEARAWFKNLYQDRFLLRTSDMVEGKRVYFYHIVKNPEVYQHYMESFGHPVKHEITNPDTFKSYSTVEITEDGNISFTV